MNALRNQNGSAIVMALVASLVLAFAAMFAQQQAVATEKNLRHLRLRNLLTLRENLARTLLGQSAYYNCTGTGASFNCNLRADKLKDTLNLPIPGCENESGPTVCGIVFDEDSYVFTPGNPGIGSEPTVQIRMIYNGQELGLAPVESTTAVTIGFMATAGSTSPLVSCTPDRPFLSRINPANGQPECSPISQERNCPAGTYLRSLNSSMRAECVAISTTPVSCGDGFYMSSYQWHGESNYQPDCTEQKLNPFIKWPRLL